MTRRSIQQYAAWLLVALLTIVSGFRDGLHLIPGLGHEVMLGERVLLLGAKRADPFGESFSADRCLAASNSESAAVLDESECPICHVLGMKLAAAASGTLLPAEPQAAPPRAAVVEFDAFLHTVYQARAPPRA